MTSACSRTARGRARVSPTPTCEPLLGGWLRSFDRRARSRAFSAIDRALEALDRNASPKIVADWLAFQL